MATRAPRPLRIGMNLLFLLPGAVGGTEIFVRNLLDSLARLDRTNEYFVFRNAETGSGIVPAQGNFVDCPQPVRAASRPARIAYEQTFLVLEVLRRRIDVLFNGGFTAPLLCQVPMVTVFYDLQYKVHPEYFRPLDLLFWRMLLPASARRSRRIVAMSEAARGQLDRYYPWCSGKIDIVPHGIEARFSDIANSREAAPSPAFLLAVSTLGPHKNYERLLEAFARYHTSHPAVRLVIAGIKGTQTERLAEARDRLGLRDDVTFTGWIPREALYELFERATAFVYPSSFEGFGIPVLEALAAGIPTACSAIPSLLEIAGDGARFFDPNDAGAIAAALADVTDDEALRERLARAGRARALAFGSEASAARMLESLIAAVPARRSALAAARR
jgi:glycosyltransferase involved in cell wall biosynthesis